uniref:cytochrome c3 family protein n=1 Tax=Propionivibrio sp. TaxID=2212460 RepID=UPI002638E582
MRSLFNKVLVATLLHLAFLSVPALAQDKPAAVITPDQLEKIRIGNNECFACHSADGIAHPPKQGMDLKLLRGLVRDANAFYGSDHQRLACTKCHNEGYDEHPHAADAKDMTTTCSDCHDKTATLVGKQFDKSVHAKNLADKFTCATCHDPHLMRLAAKLGDPQKIVAQDNRVCLSCHDSDDKFAKFAPDKKIRPRIDDLHDWLPNTRAHWKAVRCVECHTPAVAAGEPISHEILNKDKAEKKCLACHSANSSLNTRLYRHLAKEEHQRLGFANSVILSNSYVLGATRHPLIDTLLMI